MQVMYKTPLFHSEVPWLSPENLLVWLTKWIVELAILFSIEHVFIWKNDRQNLWHKCGHLADIFLAMQKIESFAYRKAAANTYCQ